MHRFPSWLTFTTVTNALVVTWLLVAPQLAWAETPAACLLDTPVVAKAYRLV